ncbi:MAG: molybdopterin-containing oxidoreductase family protein, partial [Phreatobacter sp.]
LRMRDVAPEASEGDDFAAFDEGQGRVVAYDRRRDPEASWAKSLALQGAFEVAGIVCRPAFDLYAARCAEYPVERVAAITGVDADKIVALAEAMAEARAVSHFAWTGIGQHANSTQTSRAMATLYALTGHFDRQGGNVVPTPLAANPISQPTLLPESQRVKALGAGERPIGPAALGMVTARELYTAILDAKPYRVRALMTFGSNMLLSRGDAMLGRKALQALDFAVHCDLFDNPTAQQADILLPVGSPWEREGLKLGFDVTQAAQELVQLRPAMIPRVGQSRSDAEIVCDLARRLGFADSMFGGDIEAGWRHRLAPLGLTLEDLRASPAGIRRPVETRYRKYADNGPQGIRGFATETGRVELYSELMLRNGQAPLPAFDDHVNAPLAARSDRPFILTCAKSPYYCHSQHRQAASLRRRAREPMVALSGTIADARAIAEGDWVQVSTRSGSARFKATIDRSLARDVAVADFGWWRSMPDLGLPGYDPFSDEGSNFNRLIDADHADPVSGAPSLKSFACDVRPVATTQASRWRGQRRLSIAARRDEAGGVVELDLAGEA